MTNAMSRMHEYQADRYAIDRSLPISSALIKLCTENLGNVTADPLYSAYHHSHPTVGERVVRASELRKKKV
eukprot:GABW01001700.1.p1 GENE.GABW01001700.1~~GABW01001700.1.p1  ORF type:complete len:71 (+),score=11.66 GABW01001700.1:147-359(+)